ncbi:uncharacterized protein DUF2523 [Acidovorax sp. 69]|uniref:DUF2523 domain-containing protein n=1 Tax=Acidovorax sp. 69 TaxID=2035202 RepID=UPI000C240B54|nr:DUF2523 domain-containing protein [Acidovorax sp. 69]PJI98094.1 uncharacterized protein DUF2523 [Acidovorax sp. 69]
MGFAQLIMAMVSPIIARIFVTLGLSLVSFVGMDLLMDQVIATAQNAWGGLPAGILQLAGLAGVGQALSIIFGAIMTRVLIWNLSKTTRILSSNS